MSYYSEVILADDPVAYYQLNETSGTVAYDSTSYANNGVIESGVTINQSGAPGPGTPSMSFNGTSGYINVPNASQLNITGTALSLEIIYNVPTITSTSKTLMAQWSSTDKNYLMGVVTDSGTNAYFFGLAGILGGEYGGASVADSWTHAVFTFNGTDSIMYTNGSPATVSEIGGDITPTGKMNFYIGAGYSPVSNYFSGNLEHVAVYNTTLTQEQITNHYNAFLGYVSLNTSGSSSTNGTVELGLITQLEASGASISSGTITLGNTVLLSVSGTSESSGTVELSYFVPVEANDSSISDGNTYLSYFVPFSTSGTSESSGTVILSNAIEVPASGTSQSSGNVILWTGIPPSTGTSTSNGYVDLYLVIDIIPSGVSSTMGSVIMTVPIELMASGTSQSSGMFNNSVVVTVFTIYSRIPVTTTLYSTVTM